MGILDSIKDRFGEGSDEPAPPGGKMRQPPGREGPPGPGPEPDPGPASGRGRGPEPPRGPGGPEPPRDREPAGRRPEPGSTLDVDRGRRGPPPGEDPEFGPPGGEPEHRPPRREEPGPSPASGREPRESAGGEMPDPPRDYNLDLPEPGGEGDRLERIEEQNEMIIDLLEDIRGRMGGQRRR